jgi:succinate dehydrogenase / fumarate reductase, cytochrome b subunit
MAAAKRPLSPHLQIYRPQITSVLSISHRLTGALLAAALLVMVYWLASLAAGDAAYGRAMALLGAWPLKLLLFFASFAFFYHLCNGIRHLWWDTGRGFEIAEVVGSGWIVVIAATVLTLVTWTIILFGGGS